MTAYTKEDRKFFEAMVIKAELDIPCKDTPDPGLESSLSKWLRQYCKDHGYPAIVFPQTQNVKNFLPAGFPDAVIILHNRVIFMELKRPHGGRKSKAQNDMATMFAHLGNPIHEVKTRKRAIDLLK